MLYSIFLLNLIFNAAYTSNICNTLLICYASSENPKDKHVRYAKHKLNNKLKSTHNEHGSDQSKDAAQLITLHKILHVEPKFIYIPIHNNKKLKWKTALSSR